MARRMSVTVGSSVGSIPLSVMNACSPRALVTSALPSTPGAAPMTCGTLSIFWISA
jgi:hypothetical protein